MKLELVDINKSFGDKHVLKDVSFKAESGVPLGFLGRNGAGKTTTIRTIMDVFSQDSGKIYLDGKEFVKSENKIGYMPEERGMYATISIRDQLIYFGMLKGMNQKEAEESAKYWVDRFELNEYYKKNLDTLSKGNQQKIQIIQAVIDDPDILILDEPFSGLDPINSKALSDVMMEYIDKGKIVIFSSHQMASVEEFCDDIVIINNGKIVLNDSLDQVKREMGKGRKRVKLKDLSNYELKDYLLSKDSNMEISEDKKSLIVKANMSQEEFMSILLDLDKEIELFSDYAPSLNDVFIEVVGEYNE